MSEDIICCSRLCMALMRRNSSHRATTEPQSERDTVMKKELRYTRNAVESSKTTNEGALRLSFVILCS